MFFIHWHFAPENLGSVAAARKRPVLHAGTFCDNSQSWNMVSVEGAK